MNQNLPGHVLKAMPTIEKLARSTVDRQVLIEIAKSHVTRELIPSFEPGNIVEQVVNVSNGLPPQSSIAIRLKEALNRAGVLS